MIKILVSACLMGERVRYDGDHNRLDHRIFEAWREQARLIAFCPEVAGGLPVPRPAAEIRGGTGAEVWHGNARVVTGDGKDVTPYFTRGAEAALTAAKDQGARLAILKERSPSCGGSFIYDGRFQRRLISGQGVTASLFEQNGIKVYNELQIAEAAAYLEYLESNPK